MRRGVIDIGTNSVKLLVADCHGSAVQQIAETSRQTRLGRGLYDSGRLQPEPITDTAEAVHDYLHLAKREGAVETGIIATSAMREADNALELIDALGQAVIILSGDDEARLAYAGVTTDPRLAKRDLLVIDVGGGSTEFTRGNARGIERHESLPLGSVRLLEGNPIDDPPAAGQLKRARKTIDDQLLQSLPGSDWNGAVECELIGTGGVATIFAMMELGIGIFDRDRIEQITLTQQQATDWCERLWSLPLGQRREITGLPANRADVALFGSLIYERVMNHFDHKQLQASTRGIRFGALKGDFFEKKLAKTASAQ